MANIKAWFGLLCGMFFVGFIYATFCPKDLGGVCFFYLMLNITFFELNAE